MVSSAPITDFTFPPIAEVKSAYQQVEEAHERPVPAENDVLTPEQRRTMRRHEMTRGELATGYKNPVQWTEHPCVVIAGSGMCNGGRIVNYPSTALRQAQDKAQDRPESADRGRAHRHPVRRLPGARRVIQKSVVEYENSRNPFELRKRWVRRCLDLASEHQLVDEGIKRRGQELEKEGLKAMDALHVACAEASTSKYFLTCDDRLIRRYKGAMEVRNPVDFVLAMMGGNG